MNDIFLNRILEKYAFLALLVSLFRAFSPVESARCNPSMFASFMQRSASSLWFAGALTVFGLCLATPAAASPAAAELYVAAFGSDANPGTQSAPFRTIQRAADLARPGATIHVGPGIYQENVRTRAHGAASAWIRYISNGKWSAKVIGSGTEATWTNSGNFTEIAGFDISGSGRLGVLNRGSHTVVAGNHVHDLALSGGCTDSGGAGIMNANYRGADNDIVGNVVHDIGVPGECNGVHGIYHSNLRGRIYNNIVYRASAYGIHLWHAANSVVIANNTVFANGTSNMGGGILVGTGDRPGGVVLNNTQVINNIVYDNPAASIQEYCYPGQQCIGASNIVAGNVVYGNGSEVSLRVGSASGTIAADPQFVDYQADGTGDYRLRSTSPAIQKGIPGASLDLGAHEDH